jgi:hypothetical protein
VVALLYFSQVLYMKKKRILLEILEDFEVAFILNDLFGFISNNLFMLLFNLIIFIKGVFPVPKHLIVEVFINILLVCISPDVVFGVLLLLHIAQLRVNIPLIVFASCSGLSALSNR